MIGKYYLVDVRYGAKPGFLPPFRGVRYHLNEWCNNPMQNEKELYNHRDSALCQTEECAFGSLKRRFKFSMTLLHSFLFPHKLKLWLLVA
jgi:hypothetical protein